jgi:thiol:disulfide interchange protein
MNLLTTLGPFAATAIAEIVGWDLGAVWCHWCRVMERNTYGNPAVADLIRARHVAVRRRPGCPAGLSRPYENYGWPVTVVFSADGREIVTLRGQPTSNSGAGGPPLRLGARLKGYWWAWRGRPVRPGPGSTQPL